MIRVGSDVTWRRQAFNPEGQSFLLSGINGEYSLNLPLLGEHQLDNAAAAVAAVEVLAESGVKISPEDIAAGLAQVHWPGRLQILQREPWVIVDGAHNADSAGRLMQALRQYFEFDRAILIFGASADKNTDGMVAELASLFSTVIVTSSRHPRAVATDRLVSEFSGRGIEAEVTESVVSSVELALDRASPADLICATGSLFVVAEVMEYMANRS